MRRAGVVPEKISRYSLCIRKLDLDEDISRFRSSGCSPRLKIAHFAISH